MCWPTSSYQNNICLFHALITSPPMTISSRFVFFLCLVVIFIYFFPLCECRCVKLKTNLWYSGFLVQCLTKFQFYWTTYFVHIIRSCAYCLFGKSVFTVNKKKSNLSAIVAYFNIKTVVTRGTIIITCVSAYIYFFLFRQTHWSKDKTLSSDCGVWSAVTCSYLTERARYNFLPSKP